jgi:hypothetical protein
MFHEFAADILESGVQENHVYLPENIRDDCMPISGTSSVMDNPGTTVAIVELCS